MPADECLQVPCNFWYIGQSFPCCSLIIEKYVVISAIWIKSLSWISMGLHSLSVSHQLSDSSVNNADHPEAIYWSFVRCFCVRESSPDQRSEKYDNMRTQRAHLLAVLQFNFAILSASFRCLRQIVNLFCRCVTHTRLATVGLETNSVTTFTAEKRGKIMSWFYRYILNKWTPN